eukprot:gene14628-17281_t
MDSYLFKILAGNVKSTWIMKIGFLVMMINVVMKMVNKQEIMRILNGLTVYVLKLFDWYFPSYLLTDLINLFFILISKN